jgi:uncharacterized protein (DUF2236 family)
MKRHATRIADLLNPAAMLLPAANVIMQLSLPGVGYGVLEKSGGQRQCLQASVQTGPHHRHLPGGGGHRDRIRPRADSRRRGHRTPAGSVDVVEPGVLQRVRPQVAAVGGVDQHEFLHGPLDDATADAVYRDAKRLGTTLQVPERMWPPDRVAFDEYWKRSLDDLHIDPPVREHLRGVASVAFLPRPLRAVAGPLNLFATTGFLAPEFRAMMKLDWSENQQRRFEWLLAALRLADRLIPHRAWIFGYQLYLWDMRSRARRGRRIV